MKTSNFPENMIYYNNDCDYTEVESFHNSFVYRREKYFKEETINEFTSGKHGEEHGKTYN